MLIEIFSSTFDELGLEPKQRKAASRSLVRTLCQLSTYRQEAVACLKEELGHDAERRVFKFWQAQRTNRDLLVGVWRAVHCFVHTQNAEYAELLSGIPQRDVRYALAQLNSKDITELKNSKLNWRKPPITDKQITAIMSDIKGTLHHYAHKLRFIADCEGSLLKEDLLAMLKLEAMALIIRYEGERSRLHVKNTVLRGLKSYWSETVSYYKCQKRDAMPSHEAEDANGTHFEFQNLRQGLTVKTNSDDGTGEMENPALLSKCVTFDKEVETRSLVKLLKHKVPRYGRYLSITVFDDKKNKRFYKWVRANNKETSTTSAFNRAAKHFCAVTPHDEAKAMKIIAKELGVQTMLD